MVIIALSSWWFYNNIIFQVNSCLCWVFCVFVMSSEPFAIKGASIHDFSKWRGGGGWPCEPSQGQASVQIKQSHHLFKDSLWNWTIFTNHSRYGLTDSFMGLFWYIDISQDSNLYGYLPWAGDAAIGMLMKAIHGEEVKVILYFIWQIISLCDFGVLIF